jgi:hypothetical protein
VSIGEPDVTLRTNSTKFVVECKRPYREESIRANIKDANEQLEMFLDADEKLFGIIAISVSRILLRPTDVLVKQAPVNVAYEWNKLLDENIRSLADRIRWSKFAFHKRIVAMRFHTSLPSFVRGGASGRLAVCMLFPIGRCESQFKLHREATRIACQME